MTAPIATEAALRDHLDAWLRDEGRRRSAILVRAQATWSGSSHIEVAHERVRVIEGVSGLAALDAMRSAEPGELVAVLTPLSEAELGTAVVLAAERQRVTQLDEWSVVPAMFGVRESPARPVRDLGAWVPQTLAALRPDRGYAPAPGGVLTAEHAVRTMLVALLGLDRLDALESSTALGPLDDPGVRARLRGLDSQATEGLIKAVADHIDLHLAMALRVAARPGHVSVIAVGLVLGELWRASPNEPDAAIAAARVRIEQYVGMPPSVAAAQRFGASAQLITKRWLADGDHHARTVLEQAEALTVDLGWAEGAEMSDLLPAGLRSRVVRLARAIDAAASSPSARTSLAADAALAAIEAHGARATIERSLPTARMAVRLVRWLVAAAEASVGLNASILSYAMDGAWADLALGDIWDGDADRDLANAYRALAHAVQEARRAQDAAASHVLTGALATDSTVLPVESLLSELVVPLSAAQRVLMIVLDGMSAATAIEVASANELHRRGWTEVVREAALRRAVGIAALPTVTQYSRTSLFAGELLGGNQQTEKSRFLSAVGGVVFHKDDLRGEAGHALPIDVDDTLRGATRIVGVVLNTIDDALAAADVDSLRWSVESVAHLNALLTAAHEAGRIVVLTSDHGHIVERGGELRPVPQASARWRDPASGEVGAEEVLVTGPRVLAPGGSAVLAVSDGIRYASKRAGYHGGASLAELCIPIVVLKPRGGVDPRGWVEAPPQEPVWWNEPMVEAVAAPPESRKRPKPKSRTAPAASALFELAPESPVAAPSRDVALRLIDSPTYRARRGAVGRHPVSDEVVATIVRALVAGGGRAHSDTLATKAGAPASTMSGTLSALRRILNVDGYPVIDIDADRVSVLLDLALLREQFELGEDS